jgi:hypothetical protein
MSYHGLSGLPDRIMFRILLFRLSFPSLLSFANLNIRYTHILILTVKYTVDIPILHSLASSIRLTG